MPCVCRWTRRARARCPRGAGEFGVLRSGTRARPRRSLPPSRPLDVRVLRPGVTVRARPAITFDPPARASAAPKLSLTDLLLSRAGYADLGLRAAGFTVRQADERLRLGMVVETVDPGASLTSAGAVLVDGDGRVVARWFAADVVERPLLGAMAAPPGTYRLRVVAIDAAGRFGAAEEAVQVGLTPSARSPSGRWCWGFRATAASCPGSSSEKNRRPSRRSTSTAALPA